LNVSDIDYALRIAALGSLKPLLALFDFEAAFPSISLCFMWEISRRIGVPHHTIQAFKSFYSNNSQHVRFRSALSAGLESISGVRQGGPLSPLLFAVVMDILLRHLATTFPGQNFEGFRGRYWYGFGQN